MNTLLNLEEVKLERIIIPNDLLKRTTEVVLKGPCPSCHHSGNGLLVAEKMSEGYIYIRCQHCMFIRKVLVKEVEPTYGWVRWIEE